MSAMITSTEAQRLLRLFGPYVHDERCDYVQKPRAECSCQRAKLYAKVHSIAYPKTRGIGDDASSSTGAR